MFVQQSRAQFAPMSAFPSSPRQGTGGGVKGGASSLSPAGGGKGGGSVAPPPWAEQAMRDNLQKASNMFGGQNLQPAFGSGISPVGAYTASGYQNYGSSPQSVGAIIQPRVGTSIDFSSANGLPAFNLPSAQPVPTLGQSLDSSGGFSPAPSAPIQPMIQNAEPRMSNMSPSLMRMLQGFGGI